MNSLLFRGLKSLTFVRFRSDANAKHSPQFRQRNQNFAPKPHSPPSYKQCEHGSRLSNSGVKLSLESLSGSQFLAKKCSGVGIPRSVFQTAAKRFGQQVLRGKADITVNTLAKTLMEQSTVQAYVRRWRTNQNHPSLFISIYPERTSERNQCSIRRLAVFK